MVFALVLLAGGFASSHLHSSIIFARCADANPAEPGGPSSARGGGIRCTNRQTIELHQESSDKRCYVASQSILKLLPPPNKKIKRKGSFRIKQRGGGAPRPGGGGGRAGCRGPGAMGAPCSLPLEAGGGTQGGRPVAPTLLTSAGHRLSNAQGGGGRCKREYMHQLRCEQKLRQ